MVELRPRRAKAAPAEVTKAEETPKKPKTPKASKRKATEDVSPITTKKAKSDDKNPVNMEVEPTPKSKNGQTPVKAKAAQDAILGEAAETPAPKSTKKSKTPAKSKATETVAPQETEATPAPKSAKKAKTPAQDIETVAPQQAAETPALKSSKKIKTKTPAKSEDAEAPAPQQVADTPAPKSSKKTKTSAKAKDLETVASEEVEKTSSSKSKKNKTPAKVKVTETTVIQEIIGEDAQETPSSKTKKNKTPAKAKVIETTVVQETTVREPMQTPASKSRKVKTPAKSNDNEVVAPGVKTPSSKAKKEKTPAKAEVTEGIAPIEADKTPATKSSKKNKTPAKAKLAKETPSKTAEESLPKSTEETPAKPKGQETPASKSTKKTPKSAKKSAKKSVPVEEIPIEEVIENVSHQEDELVMSDEELDEQTKNLIKSVDVEDEDGAQSGVVLFEEGQDVGKIPELSLLSKKQQKKAQKALAAGLSKITEDTGVLYIGRLPHGFYEHEMRNYFCQFGPIRNLRVARNKQTGRSKHFAFVEFEEASTAEIVAKTMDNYLLFGHILKCSVIPKESVHDELFKGANKRFKPVPWNKMEGKSMQKPLLEDKWSRKIAKENRRRADRAKKLEAVGYEYNAPELMDVDTAKAKVAAAPAVAVVEAIEDSSTKAIEGPSAAEAGTDVVEETPKPTKRGRGRPPKDAAAEATPNKRVKRTKA